MTNIGLQIINRLKNSRIGIGPIKMSTPHALIAVGIVGFIASFLLAAILKWFGLAIAIVGVALLLWPTEKAPK